MISTDPIAIAIIYSLISALNHSRRVLIDGMPLPMAEKSLLSRVKGVYNNSIKRIKTVKAVHKMDTSKCR